MNTPLRPQNPDPSAPSTSRVSTMTYRFTAGDTRWKIDALKFDQLGRWRLYRAVNESWSRARIYSTPEAAMAAVAEGNTGVASWDTVPRNSADFTNDKWSFERW